MSSKRIEHIDILKGLLIVLVVLGHTPTGLRNYVHWFHMPVFFVTGGVFLKINEGFNFFKDSLLPALRKLIVPYFIWGVVLSLPFFISSFNEGRPSDISNRLLDILYGGEVLKGYYAVFWFITVYFLSTILVQGMIQWIRKRLMLVAFSFLLFLLGLLEGWLHQKYVYTIVWDANVVLVTQFFMVSGYLLREFLLDRQLRVRRFIGYGVGAILVSFYFISTGYFHDVDLKFARYSNPVWLLLVVFVFTGTLVELSKILGSIKFVGNLFYALGVNSLLIMYLHMAVYLFLREITGWAVLWSFMGALAAPMAVKEVIKRTPFLQRILTGK